VTNIRIVPESLSSIWQSIVQVLELGVPISRQPGLEKACDGVLHQLHHIQSTAGEAAMYSTRLDLPLVQPAVPLQTTQQHQPPQQTGGQSGTDESTNGSPGGVTCHGSSLDVWSALDTDV
jgi:hypothetical protein